MNRSFTGQSGSTLAFSVVVIFVLGVLSAIFLSGAMRDYRTTRFTIAEERAFQAAESAVDMAIVELKLLKDYGGDGMGNAVGELAGGGYEVSIEPAYEGPGEYVLLASGEYDREERRLEVVVVTGAAVGRWQHALLSEAGTQLHSGVMVDSYDSRNGSYADQVGSGHAGTQGHVLSNGDIEVTSTSTVWGDATPGPMGGTNTDGSSTVHGATAPADLATDIDLYDYDPPLEGSSSFFLTGQDTLTTGTYRYSDLTVDSNGTLTITGSVVLYVDDRVAIDGIVLLAEGASLIVHHGGGDFLVRSGARVSDTSHGAADVQVFSASVERVSVESGSEMVGAIHAPEATGEVTSNSKLYGSFVARTITVSSDCAIHYDEALLAAGGGGDDAQGVEIIMIRER